MKYTSYAGTIGVTIALIGGLTGVLSHNELLTTIALATGVGIVCVGFLSMLIIAAWQVHKEH